MESEQKFQFTVGGKKVSMSKKAVELALKHVVPETTKKYSVQIGDNQYPIKQAVSVATGAPIASFISTDAYRILRRLGFEIKE